MDPILLSFIAITSVQTIALITALICWVCIFKKAKSTSKSAAICFISTFVIYIVNQAIIIVQILNATGILINVPRYINFLPSIFLTTAAVLLGVGSFLQYKSIKK